MPAAPDTSSLPPICTADEVADFLRVKPRWVKDQMRAARLAGYQVGKEWRTTPHDVAEFLSSCRNKTEGRTSGGTQRATSGMSAGSSGAASASVQRALDVANAIKQNAPSSPSSRTRRKEPAPVIPLNGGSPTC